MDFESQVEMGVGVFYLHHAMQEEHFVFVAEVFIVVFGEDENLGGEFQDSKVCFVFRQALVGSLVGEVISEGMVYVLGMVHYDGWSKVFVRLDYHGVLGVSE
jgi:hypothetical protein